jgi:hypothetical protein
MMLFYRNKMMEDFNSILEKIEPWSLFEVNRLHSAMGKILEDPARNEAIKRQIKVGMKITYFCGDQNNLVEATIEEVKKTRVFVVNIHDGKRWNINLYLINLQGIDTSITAKKISDRLDRNTLKVGDRVGWHSKLGHDLYGVVEKLNPKKAVIRLSNDEQWRVPYSILFVVMDGVSIQGERLCIEGKIIR